MIVHQVFFPYKTDSTINHSLLHLTELQEPKRYDTKLSWIWSKEQASKFIVQDKNDIAVLLCAERGVRKIAFDSTLSHGRSTNIWLKLWSSSKWYKEIFLSVPLIWIRILFQSIETLLVKSVTKRQKQFISVEWSEYSHKHLNWWM